jgi:hypothetical protein
MRKGFLSAVLVSLTAAGFAPAQAPVPAPPMGALTYSAPTASAPAPSSGMIMQEKAPVQHWANQSPPLLGDGPDQGMASNATSCCGTPDWCGQGPCGPAGRFWVSAEYLVWWIRDSHLPPLVTTGPANAAQIPPPGALGSSTTRVLFGGDLDHEAFSGGRFTAGLWLNDCQTVGFEASYFFLGSRSNDFTAGSSGAAGSSVLARPFFDVSTGLPNVELVAFPGLASGTVHVHSSSRLQGPEANLLCNLCCSAACCDCCNECQPAPGYRVDLLGGFRWLESREGLGITEDIQVLPTSPVFTGDHIRVLDQFDTRNEFYGGQIGLRAEVWRNRFFANIAGKVALGDTHQTVDINGGTTVVQPGGPALVKQGGLLALPSNIGSYSRDEFSVVPEVDFNVGYQLTNNLRVFVGYTFLYWSDVVRPGDVIDLNVNSTRLPTSLIPPSGPLRPQFTFRDSDYWAQGVNFGVQVRY